MNIKLIWKTITIVTKLSLVVVFLTLAPLFPVETQGNDTRMVLPLRVPADSPTQQVECFLKIARQLQRGKFTQTAAKIADLLQNAAELEADGCGQQYLLALAAQVPRNSVDVTTPQWMELEKNGAEILFFPGTDTPSSRMDTVIYVNDHWETARFKEYGKRFTLMQNKLPVTANPAFPMSGFAPSFKIAHLVYSSLPFSTGLVYPGPTLFYRSDSSGFKVVIFKNVVEAYWNCVLTPLAQEIFEEPVTQDAECYLSNLIMQKIAHQMGQALEVKTVVVSAAGQTTTAEAKVGATKAVRAKIGEKPQQKLVLISELLGTLFPLVEELKAKVVAIYNTSLLMDEGVLPRQQEINFYQAYMVDMIDGLRRDKTGPLGKAGIIQFNYLLKNGAIQYSLTSRKIKIHTAMFPIAIKSLTKKILDTFTAPYALIKEYGLIGQELDDILKRSNNIPLEVETKSAIPRGSNPTPKKSIK